MPSLRAAVLVVTVSAVLGSSHTVEADAGVTFTAGRLAEAFARITVACDACAWDTAGREAVIFSLSLDGRYSQHLPVVRPGRAEYVVFLGRVEPGSHALRVHADPELTARDLRGGDRATVEAMHVEQFAEDSPEYTALSLAPILHARANTIGRFTDVPVFMWYETEPTPRGTRYRYSVVFTNEDGGTPADRLMATWGRTTDIEYVYSVEIDAAGAILNDDYQGPDHAVLPFRGTRDARHPLLWVVTDNNMVLDEGTTRVRYAPAPAAFPLRGVSREEVMDAHPWLYAVMARELAREGKIVANAPPGNGTIPDPRRFVYVEACGEAGTAALALALRVGDEWLSSDRGMREYRIVRDGCFRGAVPLPAWAGEHDVQRLRVQAFDRPVPEGATPAPERPARLTRINKVFILDNRYRPLPSRLRWEGTATLLPGGPPLELALP